MLISIKCVCHDLFTKSLLHKNKWKQDLIKGSTLKGISLAILFQGNVIDGLILVKV